MTVTPGWQDLSVAHRDPCFEPGGVDRERVAAMVANNTPPVSAALGGMTAKVCELLGQPVMERPKPDSSWVDYL